MRLVSRFCRRHTLAPRPTARKTPPRELTDRMAQMEGSRTASLQALLRTRHYMLHNKRFNDHAEMSVRMTLRRQDKKEFEVLSEKRFGMDPQSRISETHTSGKRRSSPGGHRESRITPDNYDFRLFERRRQTGGHAKCSTRRPKRKTSICSGAASGWTARMPRWRASKAARRRILRSGLPSVHFVHQYAKVGPYWLAASNISETEVRVFGSTELKIEYLDYVINPPLGAAASGSK